MAKEKTNRDMLIALTSDMAWVKNILNDHLVHHRRLLYAGIALTSTLGVGMLLRLLA